MLRGMTRRMALTLSLSAAMAAMARPVAAQQRSGPLEVDVDQANLRPRPIAIPEFNSEDSRFGSEVADVVAANLDRSGLFRPLSRAAFIERIVDVNQTPRFADWRAVGAEALVAGRSRRTPDGRVGADFRLWDTVLGRALDGQSIATPAAEWRRIGHIIADRVYEKMTLERGYFDTQIVFVDETGPKDRRRKRLAIMDQDGHNVRLLTDGRELVLTPRFNPVRQEITYLQFEGQLNRVYTMDLASGRRSLVSDFSGKAFAPRFSPDGLRLVMSIDEGGAISLVEVDLRSRQPRRLTQPQRIDTGACYSPDGQQLVFESDREGTQQLYVMTAGGGPAQRLSRGEGRYSTPVWSPRGDFIAFTKQLGGSFLIGVMRTDGAGERILSSGFHNEGPTWAPNGRVLMFFREGRGAQGGPRLFSVDLTGYNEREVPTPAFASDPAWSPLRG